MATADGQEYHLVRFYRDAPADGRPVVGYDELAKMLVLKKRKQDAPAMLNAVVLVKTVFPGATVTQCIIHPKKRRQRKLTPPVTQEEAF